YQPIVPVVAFYGKERSYLTPLERKELNQNCSWAPGGENLPAASRTGKLTVNWSRNVKPKPSKRATGSKPGKTAPKLVKKAKGETPVGKENVNSLVKKKMDSPFRVLSMTVKPALKLPSGAAFFSAGKKSHSKKPAADTKPLQVLPKSQQENHQAGPQTAPKGNSVDKNKLLEESGVLMSQPKGKETREGLTKQEGDSTREGKTSPRENGSSAGHFCPSQSAGTGNGVMSNFHLSKPISRPQATPDELPAAFGSSPPAKAPQASQKSKKTKELSKRSRDQMIIDAGQKHFGAVVCKSCGMIYTAASPEDEAQHIQHHERFLEGLRYVLSLKGRYCLCSWFGWCFRWCFRCSFGWSLLSLEAKIRAGSPGRPLSLRFDTSSPSPQAFRVLSEPEAEPPSPERDILQQQRAWRCSAEPEPAVCGISRIWVLGPRRGKGIARRMVDVVRSTFTYGYFLSSQEIAFSDPTPDGKAFATKYCQTPNFLVYNFLYSH
ncbi:ESCO2 acetyltransferase, partial [Baryphthengus martii]|nr:ESCO2 acetyltransferase [Baryphthengus martii]